MPIHSPEIVGSVLTLIRAAHLNGRISELELPSYPQWNGLVRQTVLWLNENIVKGGYEDPRTLIKEATETSGERFENYELLHALHTWSEGAQFRAADLVASVHAGNIDLQVQLEGIAGRRAATLSSRSVGRYLRGLANRPIHDLTLRSSIRANMCEWQVERTDHIEDGAKMGDNHVDYRMGGEIPEGVKGRGLRDARPETMSRSDQPAPLQTEPVMTDLDSQISSSPGGNLFFGDPQDVKKGRIISFHFMRDGIIARAFPATEAEVVRNFKLTARQIAVVRVAFRLVFRDPLDMPHPPLVPDPATMRTCDQIVASVEHGCLLLHLIHCARVSREYCYSAARGLYQTELDAGLQPAKGLHATLAGIIRGELISELGPERSALFGLSDGSGDSA